MCIIWKAERKWTPNAIDQLCHSGGVFPLCFYSSQFQHFDYCILIMCVCMYFISSLMTRALLENLGGFTRLHFLSWNYGFFFVKFWQCYADAFLVDHFGHLSPVGNCTHASLLAKIRTKNCSVVFSWLLAHFKSMLQSTALTPESDRKSLRKWSPLYHGWLWTRHKNVQCVEHKWEPLCHSVLVGEADDIVVIKGVDVCKCWEGHGMLWFTCVHVCTHW